MPSSPQEPDAADRRTNCHAFLANDGGLNGSSRRALDLLGQVRAAAICESELPVGRATRPLTVFAHLDELEVQVDLSSPRLNVSPTDPVPVVHREDGRLLL